jgi:ribosomal protein S18 acetylase RimI-like enzyme
MTVLPQQLNMQPATQADVPQIAELTHAAYEKYIPRIGRKPQPMLADYSAMLETHQIWLLRQNADLQGLLVLQENPDHLLIYSIAVSPAHQAKGIGKQLLLWTEQHASQMGCKEIRLYTNEKMTENIALYTKMGYTETHREDMNGWQVVHMAKSVGSGSR